MPEESAIKIAVLEERYLKHERSIDRIDSAIEKIAETNQQILKMLALHDGKISHSEKLEVSSSKEIEEVKNKCDELQDEFSKKIDNLEEKISELVKIKWMTIGMATLLVILITAYTQLAGGILDKDEHPATIHQTELK